MHRHVRAVRGFNRFYTKQIGLLRKGYLGSPFSLAEVRVLYEVIHRKPPAAADLAKDLGLDPGYLSRMLRGFEKQGLISRSSAPDDARQNHISLTEKGRKAFVPLDERTRKETA